MRDWNLQTGDPLSLFLAADARFCVPDYADDQVWELSLGGGAPPAMAVETMLGLRAVNLRIYPAFFIGGTLHADPSTFAHRPAVRRFAPNYLQIVCRPVEGLEAVCEYWVPHSHALSGRITLRTMCADAVHGECWLCAVHHPAAEGSPFTVESIGPYGGVCLRARAGNLSPVLALGGVAGSNRSAAPSLKSEFTAKPGEPAHIRWAHAGRPSFSEGLGMARALTVREWDADIARVEMENAALPEIETGRPDWDAVLAFSQVTAVQALIGATGSLPCASAVVGRNPERGYSLRGDGSDAPAGWSGAGLWDLMMILPVWGMVRAEMAKDLLRNFASAAGDGLPDARPGPGGQRAHLLAPPLIAQLAWRALSGCEDAVFLAELWPLVDRTLEAWFSAENDRDQDGLPEWARMDSLNPVTPHLWEREGANAGGMPPCEMEAPSLAALLAGECHAAARMAEVSGSGDAAEKWRRRAAELRKGIERMGHADGYWNLDRESHTAPAGRLLWEGAPGGEIKPAALAEPARILIRIAGGATTRPVLRMIVAGRDARGVPSTEEIQTGDFQWLRGSGSCMPRVVWQRIDSVQAEGPLEGMTIRIEVPDFRREDLSNLLPLWSRVTPAGSAERMFRRLEDPSPFGARCGLRFSPPEAEDVRADGWMLWNMLMGEAALRYGKDRLVLAWMEKMFAAAAESLRSDRAFRSAYFADRPGAGGQRNSLHGIFPVGLFFAALGVFPAGAGRVWVGGRSVFPQPVTLRYKGLILLRHGDRTEITFPSGAHHVVEGVQRRLLDEDSIRDIA